MINGQGFIEIEFNMGIQRAEEGTAHLFFVRTTNDVTIKHYFFRSQPFFVRALLLCFQMYIIIAYKSFFKFRQRHVIQYDLILLKIHLV